MSGRDGEILLETPARVVVRGYFTAEEMQRRTGWSGDIRHAYWRHAYMPLRQRQLIDVPRGKFVEARKPGPGAFKVTILDIRREA